MNDASTPAPVPDTSARIVDPIVEIDDLKVWFASRDGITRAVDGVSFDLQRGETLGLVGESGCGKSVTAMTMLQLIPSPPSVIAGGAIRYNGANLLEYDEDRMRRIRGNEISMIFQEPMTSLNPVLTVGRQIRETLRLHQGLSRQAAQERRVPVDRPAGERRELGEQARVLGQHAREVHHLGQAQGRRVLMVGCGDGLERQGLALAFAARRLGLLRPGR